MSARNQSINGSTKQSSRMTTHLRESTPQTSINCSTENTFSVDKKTYPQQYSLRITTLDKNQNVIKPVLRKRREYAFSADSMRLNNGGIYVPSWRKDGIKKREQLLQEDEENGGNNFIIDRRSNLKNYYAIAERVLDQFQITCASSNKLEETYLMGNRLIKFLSDVLPNHSHYLSRDPSLTDLRIKSQNDLALVRNQVDDVALLLDKETYKQIMKMEGMEGDFCPSPPSSRRKSRKRVTFDLKRSPSPNVPFDAQNEEETQQEQQPQHQHQHQHHQHQQHRQQQHQESRQQCDNNHERGFEWSHDEPIETFTDHFEKDSTTPPEVSSSILFKDVATKNENDGLGLASESWESFGGPDDCDVDWNWQWPVTEPIDVPVVSSQQSPTSNEDKRTQQQQHGASSYSYSNVCDGDAESKGSKYSLSNDGDCVSSFSQPERMLDKYLSRNAIDTGNVCHTVPLRHVVKSNTGSIDKTHGTNDDIVIETMGNKPCNTDFSTSSPTFLNGDPNGKISSRFETGSTDMKLHMPAKDLLGNITSNENDMARNVETEAFQLETPSSFGHNIFTDQSVNYVNHAINNNDVNGEGVKCLRGKCSFDDDSDEDLEHQEYVKKMTEEEFCDDMSTPDKTISTAETESMTVDNDSQSESPSEVSEGEEVDESITKRIGLVECKVKDLQQGNRGQKNTDGERHPTYSHEKDSLTNEGEITVEKAFISDHSGKQHTSSVDITPMSQNDVDVSTLEEKCAINHPLRSRVGFSSVSQSFGDYLSSAPTQGYFKSQGQASSIIAISETSSKSQSSLASVAKYAARRKGDDSVVNSLMKCSVSSPKSHARPKLRGAAQNNLIVNSSPGRYRLKYPLHRRTGNASVLEGVRDHSLSTKPQALPKAIDPSSHIGVSQEISRSQNDQVKNNKSDLEYRLQSKDNDISLAESLNQLSLPSSQTTIKLQDQPRNSLVDNKSEVKCHLRCRAGNAHVVDSSRNNLSPPTPLACLGSQSIDSHNDCLTVNNTPRVGASFRRREQSVSNVDSHENYSSRPSSQASLKSQSQNPSTNAPNEQSSSSQEYQSVDIESRNSQILRPRTGRTNAARLKSLKKTAAWKRRYSNTSSTTK